MLTIVTTGQRPDLAEVTGRWRWEAFFYSGRRTLEDTLLLDRAAAISPDFIPSVFVLLDGKTPLGMVAICQDDLEGFAELNPWLAGLYVAPEHRGRGHARRLIAHLESEALGHGMKQLNLYCDDAAGFYRKLGWQDIDRFEDEGKSYFILCKQLGR